MTAEQAHRDILLAHKVITTAATIAAAQMVQERHCSCHARSQLPAHQTITEMAINPNPMSTPIKSQVPPKLKTFAISLGVATIVLLGVNALAPTRFKPNGWTWILTLTSTALASGYSLLREEGGANDSSRDVANESANERNSSQLPVRISQSEGARQQVEEIKARCALRFAQEVLQSPDSQTFWQRVETGSAFMDSVRTLSGDANTSANRIDYSTVQSYQVPQTELQIAAETAKPIAPHQAKPVLETPHENNHSRSADPQPASDDTGAASVLQEVLDSGRVSTYTGMDRDLWEEESKSEAEGIIQHEIEEELV